MLLLIVGLLLFLGIHSLSIVAPHARHAMVAKLGIGPWKALYSLASLLGFALLVYGYGLARQEQGFLYHPPTGLRHLAALLMLLAFPILLATYLPGKIKTTLKHPMLVAVKLWALAHLLANGGSADVLLFGAFLAWAVADRISLKRRLPKIPTISAGNPRNDILAIIGGLVLYGGFIGFAHKWLFGVSPMGG